MSLFLIPLLIGFVFAGASAFTAAYFGRFNLRVVLATLAGGGLIPALSSLLGR